MHEDVITNLALIRELRVISRTTVETYRGSQKPLRQIAGELGVAYILEGSVRRAGQKVRVTGQLIDARTDEHVWAKAYDRDLSDIFAIQAELAQAIATALQAALSPQEKSLLERRPTDNLAAYDLYLKARERRNNEGAGPDAVRRQEPLIESAVTLDPNFAVAWADLAFIHGVQYGGYTDHTPARAAQAKAALDHAVRLAPDAPETIRESGDYRCDVLRDYAGAVEQYERLLRLRPSDAHAYWSLGKIYRELGQWRESAANLHRATQLDPASFSYGGDLVALLWGCRRYDEALTEQRRLTARGTAANFNWRRALGMLTFAARGSTGEMEAFLATQQKEQGITPRLTVARKEWARARGDFPEAIRLDRLQAYYRGAHDDLTLDGEATQASDAALTLAAVGDRAAARARLGNLPVQIRARLELEPENAVFWSTLGPMEAMLENREEAERCARRAVELLPESRSQWSSVAPRCNQVIVLAWIGERDRALAELSSLMETSPLAWRMSVHHLKHGPWLYPLRDDPRYQALLDSPKSNAPLF
jgi:tetratricopeptide (TPR) repeat protein